MKEKKFILTVAAILAVLFLYLIFVRVTGTGIPCPIHTFTGYNCITCGITRMFAALSQGHFREAYEYNRFMFFAWPVAGAEALYVIYRFTHKEKLPRWNVAFLWVLLAAGLTFMVIRNIIGI